jgi:nucleoside 2-deoxyribosyltransferase
MTTKQKLYLAGPLFSDAEKEFNRSLKSRLEQFIDVYLPQEDGGLVVEMVRAGISEREAWDFVFKKDIEEINDCNVFLIILDGRAVDEGAAVELGIAYALKKECIGLQTDPRRLLPNGNNPMISGALRTVFHSVQDLVQDFIARYATAALPRREETERCG